MTWLLFMALSWAEERCYPSGLDTEAYCKSMTTSDGIDLHMIRLPAIHPSPHADPLFILAGGPGQAATHILLPLNRRFHTFRQAGSDFYRPKRNGSLITHRL